MEHTKISTDIEQNIKQFQQLFADSADIKMKEMRLGKGKRRRCFLAYIEVAVSNMLLETTALGRLLAALSELPDRDLNQVLNENAMGISDVTPYDTIEDAAQGMQHRLKYIFWITKRNPVPISTSFGQKP